MLCFPAAALYALLPKRYTTTSAAICLSSTLMPSCSSSSACMTLSRSCSLIFALCSCLFFLFFASAVPLPFWVSCHALPGPSFCDVNGVRCLDPSLKSLLAVWFDRRGDCVSGREGRWGWSCSGGSHDRQLLHP
ncbi:hypothetical protein IWZ00DRAFT_379751 [Phyllosticta capitalensis]